MARPVPKTHITPTYRKRKCPACGGVFEIDMTVPDAAWGYAYDGLLTCSYHCMRELERRDREGVTVRDADRRVPREVMSKRRLARQRRVAEARANGLTLQQIADLELVAIATIARDLQAMSA